MGQPGGADDMRVIVRSLQADSSASSVAEAVGQPASITSCTGAPRR